MDKTIVALIVGLLAGGVGGYVATMFGGSGSGGSADAAPSPLTEDRLESIETALNEIRSQRAGLAGSRPAAEAGEAGGMLAGGSATVDALVDRIDARMRTSMKDTLSELKGSSSFMDDAAEAPARKPKKRMKLADAAMELGLSTAEETSLLRTYEEYEDKAIDLIAENDEEAEEIRAKFKAASKDPMKMFELISYLPRIIPKASELATLRADREQAIEAAIGKENAKKLQDEYTIEEAGIFGFGDRGGTGMRMDISAGSGR